MFKLQFIIFLIVIFSGCKVNTRDNSSNLTSVNSNLIQYETINDTLRIVTTDSIGYYPFGVFNDWNQMIPLFKGYTFARIAPDRFYIKKQESTIEFFEDRTQESNQIVKGVINDDELKLVNSFQLRTSIDDVKSYFGIDDKLDNNKLNMIIIETGLEGMKHIYSLENSRISKIEFMTDYTFKE